MKTKVKIGQKINVYIDKLNRSDVMTIIEILDDNIFCCDYHGIEESATAVPFGDSYRFECVTEESN